MDTDRFDDLLRALASGTSRRGVLASLAGGLLAALPLALGGDDVAAKKRGKKKKRKKKKKKNNNGPPPPPTCSDGIKNGGETGVDCGGGPCPRCGNGQTCASPTDCQSALCASGTCQACGAGTPCPSGCSCSSQSVGVCSSNTGTGAASCAACPAGTVDCRSLPIGGIVCFPRCGG